MALGPRRRFEATCYPHLQMVLGPIRRFETTCYPHLQMALGPIRRFEATCYPHLQMALGPRRRFETTCYPHLQMALGPRRRFETTCYPHLQMALGLKRHFEATCYPHLPMLRSVRLWKWGEFVHRNVGIRLAIDATSRNGRSESSTRQLRKIVCCDCELVTEPNLSRPGQGSVRFITGTLPRRRRACFIPWFVLCQKSWQQYHGYNCHQSTFHC